MKRIITSLLIVVAFTTAFSQQANDQIAAEWTKMNNTKTKIYKDYNDLKFGMFIHWGAYSSLGGMWKGEKIPGLGEWVMWHAEIPREEYKEVCRNFNPVNFNADEWVRIAKDAGMKYIVCMPKHHDGFAMYDSKVTDYDIIDMSPFKRDPIDEIYKACKKHGIRMGIYYSHSIDWMDGGDAGQAQTRKTDPGFVNKYATNNFDPSPVSFEDYIEKKAKPQMREILTKFPNLIEIWYDYPNQINRQQSFEFYKLAYEYQPKCLINSRVGNDLGDVLTAGDNQIPVKVASKYKTWETPGTLNNTWGYKSYDNNWKSFDEMLFWIVEIASKGGNYLLNVGPDGTGKIPDESISILKKIGSWMKVNGEAVYGTAKWTTLKEGPTSLEMKSTTDREKKGFSTVFTPRDFWFTSKGKNVYAISIVEPEGGKTAVEALAGSASRIKSIRVLGHNKNLNWKLSGNKVEVELPSAMNFENGLVLKVALK